MAPELRELGINEQHVVAGITMDPGQEIYAGGSMEQVFEGFEGAPHGCHPFALIDNGIAVGFLVVREGDAVPGWVKSGCVSIHNLRIDQAFQGKSYGKTAMRLAARWIMSNRPSVTHVMASVNVQNALAMRFNMGRGFQDTGVIVEGRRGPQKVLIVPVERLARDH